MQLSFRATGFLIVIYLLGLAGAGWYLSKDYREASRLVLRDTVTLIAGQVSASLELAGGSRVLARERHALETFRKTINAMVAETDQITRLAVFGPSGNLLAGEAGGIFPRSSGQFTPSRQSISNNHRFSGLHAGRYDTLIPLRQDGKVIAHLGIQLDNKSIGSFYDQLTRPLVILGFAGSVVLLLFGGLLYRELRRTDNDLVKKMQSTLPHNSERDYAADGFHNARIQTLKTGSESQQHYDSLNTLSRAMKVGLALFGKDASEIYLSDNAREILDLYFNETLADGIGHDNWQTLKSSLQTLADSPHASSILELEVESGAIRKKLEIELYRMRDIDGNILTLMRDHDHVTALQSSLRAATRMHTLSSIYLSAAHDLRAPISAMVLTLELLGDSLADSANQGSSRIKREDQHRYISILRDELDRLQRFLTSFLNNATTVRQSSWQSVNLVPVVLDLLRLFSSKARQSGVEIHTDIEETTICIMADGDQLRQMLMNIIVNALEVMPNGGELFASIHRDHSTAVIRIRDTGPGMSPSVLNQVFDMHFTTKDTGTGIGLYVAKSVIQQHGGNIQANNTLDQGTEFVITLPLGPGEPA